MKRKPKIGAYLRVSTTDKQTTKSQRHSVREWTKKRGRHVAVPSPPGGDHEMVVT